MCEENVGMERCFYNGTGKESLNLRDCFASEDGRRGGGSNCLFSRTGIPLEEIVDSYLDNLVTLLS